jgi:hypothetical protein
MWLSVDPAMGEYVPQAPINDEAKKYNQNLPGQGGVFNVVNLHVYHYAGNNPVKYVDPEGLWINNQDGTFTAEKGDTLWGLYGSEWKEKSGYTDDPTKLQAGETVGYRNLQSRDKIKIHPPIQRSSEPSNSIKSETATTNNSQTIYYSFGGKMAAILGLGGEIGVALDTDGNIAAFASGSIGVGIQTPTIKGNGLFSQLVRKSVGHNGGWTQGNVPSTGFSHSTTVDVGILLMATYDLNNLNKNGLPTGLSYGGIGGGVWKNGIFTARIPIKLSR